MMKINEQILKESNNRKEQLKKLNCFDASLWMGEPSGYPFAESLDIKKLPALMRKYHIKEALISHWEGVTISPEDGNQSILYINEDLPKGVFTVWTGLPLFPREQDPLPGFGVPHPRMRGIRLYPKTQNFSLGEWIIGSLGRWMTENRMPLFIQHVETQWNELYLLAETFPELNIVVESQWQKIIYHTRPLFNLMKAHRNVLLETSNFVCSNILEYAVGELGADRFLFGSFAPMNDPFVSIGMIIDARISEEEKALIAGDNLRHILEGVAS